MSEELQTSGQTDATEGESLVEIHDADDAKLDEALAELLKFEDSDAVEESEDEDEQPQEDARPESPEEEAEPAREEPDDKQDRTSKTVSREEYENLVNELNKVRGLYQQSEHFNQRQKTEIGDLRAALAKKKEQLQSILNNDEYQDPKQTYKVMRELENVEQQEQGLEQQEFIENHVKRSQQIVAQHLNPEKVNLNDMVSVLQEDGVSNEWLANFAQNPHAVTTPDFIVQLGKRVEDRKNLVMLAKAYKAMQAENENLKKRANGSAQSLTKKLDAIARTKPQLTAASGGSSTSGSEVRKVNPALLSDEELNTLLES